MKQIHRNITIAVLFVVGVLATLAAAVPPPADYNTDRILDAIRQVETGGCKNPSEAVGDGGRAIGPFQIHQGYWADAVQHDPSIGGEYSDCTDEAYARQIVIAYLSRYCKSWTDENCARIHNGGCGILKKSKASKAWKNTTIYWQKVQKHLD
jgi:hypothetical protein